MVTTDIKTYRKTKSNFISNDLKQRLLEVKKGDLLSVDFGKMINNNNDFSVQKGKRPVVVIQNDIGNKFSPTIWVATITSNTNKNKLPTHVKVSEETGLRCESLVLIEQVFTIDKKMIISKLGRCSEEIMKQIDMAVKIQAGTIDLNYINDTIDWIVNVETRSLKDGFDPDDAKLHERLTKEVLSYCQQYSLNYKELKNSRMDKYKQYKEVI